MGTKPRVNHSGLCLPSETGSGASSGSKGSLELVVSRIVPTFSDLLIVVGPSDSLMKL